MPHKTLITHSKEVVDDVVSPCFSAQAKELSVSDSFLHKYTK